MFNSKKPKWFVKAKKLFRKNKLEEPYASLFNYFICLFPYDKKEFKDHYEFFDDCERKGISLEDMHSNLSQILPLQLLENFESALHKYKQLKRFDLDLYDEEDEKKIMKLFNLKSVEDVNNLFDKEDFFMDDFDEEIEEILKNYFSLNL